jgi:hypothetical protein
MKKIEKIKQDYNKYCKKCESFKNCKKRMTMKIKILQSEGAI